MPHHAPPPAPPAALPPRTPPANATGVGLQASFVRVLPEVVGARGLPTEAIWAALGLRPDGGPDETRVPVARLCQALSAASALAGDPSVVLDAARSVRPAHLGNLGYMLMSSPQGQDGLALFERFQGLLCNELRSHHTVSGHLIVVRHEAADGGVLPRHALFWWFLLGARLHFARWVSGRDLVPVRMDIPAPPQPGAAAFERFVGASVRHDTPDARELMPAQWLHWFNPNADPGLHSLMAARTAQQWDQAAPPAGDALLGRMRQLLVEALTRGDTLGLDGACQALALSPRQLQKRLCAQGLSFKALVEEVRRERALRLLRESARSLQEVAAQCGYAEPSPFHRAVRRWTGLTPAEVRQQAQAPTASAPPK